ncbi:MAG TPA: hypothetical protein VNA25_11820, partial [Phycisphaerae bacterium]|nr:hypothetical protein [Phycisphaerae bacterium]
MTEEAYKRTRETELETGRIERAQSLHPSIEGRKETIGAMAEVGAKELGSGLAGATVSQLIRTPAEFLARGPAKKRDIEVQPPGVVHGLGPGASAVPPDLGQLYVPEAAPIADWAEQVLKDHPHWTPKQWEAGVGALEDPLAMMDSVISAVPLMAASVLATTVGHPEAGMMLIYAVEAQSAYEEAYEYAIAHGTTEPEAKIQAERISQAVGVAISISEYFKIKGFMRVTGLLKKGGEAALHKTAMALATKLNAANAGAEIAALARDLLVEMGKEYGQEFSQEMMATLIPTAMQGREFNTFDMLDMIDRANKAGLSVAPMVGLPGGARIAAKAGLSAVAKAGPVVATPAAPSQPVEPPAAAPLPAAEVEPTADTVTIQYDEHGTPLTWRDVQQHVKDLGGVQVDAGTGTFTVAGYKFRRATFQLPSGNRIMTPIEVVGPAEPAQAPLPAAAPEKPVAKPEPIAAPVAPKVPKAREEAPSEPGAKAEAAKQPPRTVEELSAQAATIDKSDIYRVYAPEWLKRTPDLWEAWAQGKLSVAQVTDELVKRAERETGAKEFADLVKRNPQGVFEANLKALNDMRDALFAAKDAETEWLHADQPSFPARPKPYVIPTQAALPAPKTEIAAPLPAAA